MAKECHCAGFISQEPKDIAKGGLQISICTSDRIQNSEGKYTSSFITIPFFGAYAQKLRNMHLKKGDVVEANWIEVEDKDPYIKEYEENGKIVREKRPNVKIHEQSIWRLYSPASRQERKAEETEETKIGNEEAKDVVSTSAEMPVEPVSSNASNNTSGRADGAW